MQGRYCWALGCSNLLVGESIHGFELESSFQDLIYLLEQVIFSNKLYNQMQKMSVSITCLTPP